MRISDWSSDVCSSDLGYRPVMDADGPAPKVLLADKGYDADFIRQDMEKRGGVAMIPTKRNRLVQLPVDADIYALRNMVERCFNKLKNARRLANRYDKTSDSYPGFIHLVSIRLWKLGRAACRETAVKLV